MKHTNWRQKSKLLWLTLTIKKKITFFASIVCVSIFLSMLIDFWIVKFVLNDFQVILEHNARSSTFLDAMEAESALFIAYIKNPSEENKNKLVKGCEQTKESLLQLPYDYAHIGQERYAKTWSIHNSYKTYQQKREGFLKWDEESPGYITELYKIYSMQDFLQEYAKTLMKYTLEEGARTYVEKISYFKQLPVLIFIVSILLLLGMIYLVRLMNQAIIVPIFKLVSASKKIAGNEFFLEDVKVDNQDEMGELVETFNRMKDVTGAYILMLEEKRKMTQLLHQEELEKVEMEKHLEATKLELLKNQMNPHFLFNTLNVLAGMARLEEAKTTEQMIRALSTLFRYNLKTSDAEVTLAQELKIAKDYMYLQQMRFGRRIKYEMFCKINPERIKVPAFSFQPLIENAVIHGLAKKEEGGTVYVRIWQQGRFIMITVTDTGMGMTNQKLDGIRCAFKQGHSEEIGIGLGNIYKRVHGMYKEGEVEVFSKENIGTAVRLKIPQMEWGA